MQRTLPLPRGASSLLAIATGALYFLAFPGVDIWPLSFVALVPLLIALRGQSPRRGLWLGWLSGFTMTMCGFYWLLDMLQSFSGFPLPLCFLFMAILCGYQGGRMGLLGWLYARAEGRGWPREVVFALAFAASEQAFPLLFPWTYAATVHQVAPLVQLAEIGGPILVALTLVAANLALAEVVFARFESRAPRWKRAAVLVAAPVFSVLYGLIRIVQVDATVASAPKGDVGLVQANMSLTGKREEKDEGLKRHMLLTRKLARENRGLDLVVWSETSVMSAVDESEASKVIPITVSGRLNVPAIFGVVLNRPVQDERKRVHFNSAVATDRKGRLVGRYDKQFLLAFGEYLPLGETFPKLYRWSPQSGRFSPGKSLLPLRVGGHEVATFICYEDIVPSFVNDIVRAGTPDLLANLTNDAWFGDSTEPWIHLALSKFRAIEHRRFFVRSTNSGVSAFIDPVGRVVAQTEPFKEVAIQSPVAFLRTTTPYEVLGDVPWWLATIAAAALAGFRRRPRVPLRSSAESKSDPDLESKGQPSNPAELKRKANKRLRRRVLASE